MLKYLFIALLAITSVYGNFSLLFLYIKSTKHLRLIQLRVILTSIKVQNVIDVGIRTLLQTITTLERGRFTCEKRRRITFRCQTRIG